MSAKWIVNEVKNAESGFYEISAVRENDIYAQASTGGFYRSKKHIATSTTPHVQPFDERLYARLLSLAHVYVAELNDSEHRTVDFRTQLLDTFNAEIHRLRMVLEGITSCSTCKICRDTAKDALRHSVGHVRL